MDRSHAPHHAHRSAHWRSSSGWPHDAGDPEVEYLLSEQEVKDLVSNALSGTDEDIDNAYAFLKDLNESGCTLNHIRD